MIHETAADRAHQNTVGEILAEAYGMAWTESKATVSYYDGMLNEAFIGKLICVEVKWREKKYEDFRIDRAKILHLLEAAAEEKVIPLLAVRVPGEIWVRLISVHDDTTYPIAKMSLNEPRDEGDVEDDVIVYPWEAFQIVKKA